MEREKQANTRSSGLKAREAQDMYCIDYCIS